MLRDVNTSDAAPLAEIYNYFILNSVATFEENPISEIEMRRRIKNHNREYPWLVWVENDKVLAYAYAQAWKKRSAYKRSAESSIYVCHTSIGKGIGFNPHYAIENLLRSEIPAK